MREGVNLSLDRYIPLILIHKASTREGRSQRHNVEVFVAMPTMVVGVNRTRERGKVRHRETLARATNKEEREGMFCRCKALPRA